MLGKPGTLGIEASRSGERIQGMGEVTHGLGVSRENLEVVLESIGDRHEGALVIPAEFYDAAIDSRHRAKGLLVDVGKIVDHGP